MYTTTHSAKTYYFQQTFSSPM